MKKTPSGTISIQSDRDRLRINLPRNLWEDRRREFIYLQLADTPENRLRAKAIVNEMEIDLIRGAFDYSLEKYQPKSYVQPAKILLKDLWTQYAEYKKKSLSSTTILKDFKAVANCIDKLPCGEVDALSARKNYRFLVREFTPDRCHRYLQQFKACCEWAKKEEIIPENPFVNLHHIKRQRHGEIKPFTIQERDIILKGFENSIYYRYYTNFVRFLFMTGCRTSEAIALKWKHISDCLKYITFCEAYVEGHTKETKTGKNRRFPINADLKSLLLATTKDSDSKDSLVFPSPNGKHIDNHNFTTRAWRSILAANDVDYRKFYNTRHSFITWCLEEGIPVQQIAQWVGNSSATIYKHYAGIVSALEVPSFALLDTKNHE